MVERYSDKEDRRLAIKVHVELSSLFQSIGSSSDMIVDLGEREGTVKGLLQRLSEKYGERMRALLFEKGKDSILPGLMVLVNDRTYTGVALGQKSVPLVEGDKVSLLYFVSGG